MATTNVSKSFTNVLSTYFPVLNILNIVVFAGGFLLTLFLSVAFLPYKLFVYLIIRWKYGSEFYSMMDGSDSLFAIKDNTRSISNGLDFFPKYDTPGENTLNYIRSRVYSMEHIIPKLFVHRRYCMGYYYFVKGKPWKCVVREMKPYKTMEDVRQLVSDYSNEPIGDEDDRLYELIVGVHPIMVNGKECNVLLTRAHHCLGDAVSCLNANIAMFGTDATKEVKYAYELFKAKKVSAKNFSRIDFGNLLKRIWNLKIYTAPLFRRKERSLLHGRILSGQKNCVWLNSDLDYTRKIKEVKARFSVSFNNVLFAAAAASFSEFFQKHDPHNIPDYIIPAMVALPQLPRLEEMVTIRNNKITKVHMSNGFTVCLLHIPMIKQKNIADHVLHNMLTLKDEMNASEQSIDIFVNWLIMKYVMKYWPVPVINTVLHNLESTLIISCYPVDSKSVDYYPFVQNYKKTGIGMGFFTMNNRLKMGMNVDKTLIPDPSDAQEILQNILKYIDVLDDKSKNQDHIEQDTDKQ